MAIVLQHPRDITVTAGTDADFYCEAESESPTGEVYYQWQQWIAGQWEDIELDKNETANFSTLIITNTTEGQTGTYRCGVWDDEIIGRNYSTEADLNVTATTIPTLIVTDPESVDVGEGGNAIFDVSATGGVTPYTYTWYQVTSEIVNLPATIETQPNNKSVTEGSSVSFSITATGTEPISYEWQEFMDTDIWERVPSFNASGIDSPTLIITSTTIINDDNRRFRCMVYNSYGDPDYSNTAILTVNPVNTPATITIQPTDQYVNEGSPVSFSVTATGTEPIIYEWEEWDFDLDSYFRVDPLNASGIDSPTLTLSSISAANDNGRRFRCKVDNDYGDPIFSDPANLYVNQPLPTLLPPVNFSGEATGITEVKLRWQSSNTQETHYEILRDQSSLGSFALDDPELIIEGDYYTYIDDYFLEESTTYSYTIVSRRQTDYSVSDEAGPISITTLTSQPNVVYPPTDFIAEYVATQSGIRLMWNEPVTGELPTGYLLERKVSTSSTWTTIDSLSAETTLYWDYNILENTTYNYRIQSTHSNPDIVSSDWTTASATVGEIPREAITNFTATVNGILEIYVDPFDNDPTGQTSPRWTTVPYETNYNTNTTVSIEFPRMVGVEEFVEITDSTGRTWFVEDATYNSTTDNYTLSIIIPEVSTYSLNFVYREVKDSYSLILKSVDPNIGVQLQVSDNGGETYQSYFTDYKNPPVLDFDEFSVVLVKAPANITGNTEFSHWLMNGERIDITGEEPTVELNMVLDRELVAVYRESVRLAAPQVSVIDGYQRIYIDILQPTSGEVPSSFKVYKKLYGPIALAEGEIIIDTPPPTTIISLETGETTENTNSTNESPDGLVVYPDLTIPPLEYTVPILNEHGYFFFEELDNVGGTITFIDDNVPLDYERCYVVSSNLGDTEVFAAKQCGMSSISGLGIRWTTQPESQTVDLGEDVIFTAVATGVEAIRYQWYLNGDEINGAVGTTLNLLNVTLEMNENRYYCIATDVGSGERIKTIEAILRIREIEGPSALIANVSDNNVLLSWRDNSNNEDGFIVYHSIDGSTFNVLQTVGPNVIEHIDSDIEYGTRKWYKVSAFVGTNESEFSNTETVLIEDPRSVAPYGLTATGNVASINLNWVDDSGNETGFNIWYSRNDIDYMLLADVVADTTTYTHTNLLPETTYFYKVTSYNNYGQSPFSNTASATTLPIPDAEPEPPENFVRRPIGLNAIPIEGGIVLNWIDDSTNETGFQIYRSTNGIDFDELADIGSDITSYFDQEEKGGIKYWYKIRAYNQTNISAFSNTVTAVTQQVVPEGGELTVPYDLAGASFVNKNVLYWKNSNLDVDGYNIYIDDNNDGLFEVLDSVGGSILQYTHDGLESGITISYQVTSFIGSRESTPSNTISLTTKERREIPKILVPDNLQVIASVKSLKLIWADTSYEEEGFEVWVSDNGTDFEFLTSLPENTTTFEHSIGMPGITKYYKVRAYSREIYSDFSDIASGTTREPETIPKTPTNLITFTGKRNINLYWQVNGKNEQGFYIYRAAGGTDKFLKIATIYSLGINKIDKYTDYNLNEGDRWCYKVSAFNSLGESNYSNISCTTVETKTKKPDGTDIDFDIEEFEGGFNVVDIGTKSSADWGFFTQRLTQYFDSKQSKSESDTAAYIAKLYDDTIRQGSEQYGNRILSSNPKILENFISLALNEAKAGVPNQVISQKLSQGVITYWSSVVLQANIPPPGSTMALYNSIVSPGIPNNVPVFNTTSSSDLANSLTTFFNIHTKTVAGVLTSLVSTPTGPVPTPFPWAGFA